MRDYAKSQLLTILIASLLFLVIGVIENGLNSAIVFLEGGSKREEKNNLFADIATTARGNNPSCTIDSIPDSVIEDANFDVSMTLKNTGWKKWEWIGTEKIKPYRLGSQDPENNSIWLLLLNEGPTYARVDLPRNVYDNESVVINLRIKAPKYDSANLTRIFSWQMIQENVEWFGAKCTTQLLVKSSVPTETLESQIPSESPSFSPSPVAVVSNSPDVSLSPIPTVSITSTKPESTITPKSLSPTPKFTSTPQSTSEPIPAVSLIPTPNEDNKAPEIGEKEMREKIEKPTLKSVLKSFFSSLRSSLLRIF